MPKVKVSRKAKKIELDDRRLQKLIVDVVSETVGQKKVEQVLGYVEFLDIRISRRETARILGYNTLESIRKIVRAGGLPEYTYEHSHVKYHLLTDIIDYLKLRPHEGIK